MKRLQNGSCPIHNMPLSAFPIGNEDDDRPPEYWVGHCLRKDCEFWLYMHDALGAGPWDLPAHFSHLIAPDYAQPNEVVRIEPSEKNKQEHADLKARTSAFDQFNKGDPKLFSRC